MTPEAPEPRAEGADTASPLLSVVVPMYNEAATISELLRRVLAQPMRKEIVVVDDTSTDGSASLVEGLARSHPEIRLLRHERNRGKGAAVRTGLSAAVGDTILIQDADLEYDPRDYARLLAPILEGRADVVFGSRFIGGESHRVLYYWHSVANRMLTLFSNMVTNINLSDMEVCYKVFRRDLIQSIRLRENGFGIEPELTAKVARARARIFEVGVSYSGRTYEDGKKIRLRDGIWAVWCIIKYGLFRVN